MNNVNKNIKKSLVFLLGAFVILGAYYCYILFFYGDRWFANSYNPRVRMDAWEPKVIPGDIKDRKGRTLATTIKEKRENPETNKKQVYYYRSYSDGHEQAKSSSHVVGFNNPRYGRTGAEALQIRYLMGYNNPFYERIYQKIFLAEEVGNTLFLTIDGDLQSYADKLMGKYRGSVVVMDAQSGEILTMVSHPSFNPNKLEKDLTGDVLVSRATEGLYTPGSIFKIILTASALENIEGILSENIECTGITRLGSQDISCYGGKPHGEVDLSRAFTVSCNGSYATLGVRLGRENILKTGQAFGFNQDFIFPDIKLAPSSLPLKTNISNEKLALTSIGQGNIRVTPLHMAMVAASIANDGVMMEPKLVYEVVGRNGKTQRELTPKTYKKPLSAENAAEIQGMMERVVEEGTGKGSRIKGFKVGGKTGTAEVMGEDSNLRNNAWFIGYVKDGNNRIAIALVLEDLPEGQTGGKVAAPMAGKLLKKAIDLGY